MNISARCEYACRALVHLAAQDNTDQPVNSVTIAAQQHIPEKYLAHILLQLKRVGLVRSVRGAQGGYALSRPASEITLLKVLEAIDGPILNPLPVDDDASVEVKELWGEIGADIAKLLKEITVRQIAERAAPPAMYYI